MHGGPWLFGTAPTMADAMYAPVATRYVTYDVKLDRTCAAYRDRIMAWSPMQEWIAAAADEPLQIDELEVEF
jgi:glutathione S-transferase